MDPSMAREQPKSILGRLGMTEGAQALVPRPELRPAKKAQAGDLGDFASTLFATDYTNLPLLVML